MAGQLLSASDRYAARDGTPIAEVAEQFDDLEQQAETYTLGMWVFLATEVLFFGGLFTGYAAYRHAFAAAFQEASRHTDVLMGTVNTAVLLTSSLTMALAVHTAREGRRGAAALLLLVTLTLGSVFLGVKGFEWYREYREHLVPWAGFAVPGPMGPQIRLFFVFYFFMTGLHAIHLTIGVGLLLILTLLVWGWGRFQREDATTLEMAGLYWHFIDIVWVFLYPLLYLVKG